MKAIFETTASEHRTHLINIVAEAGLGKSRLLYEFGKWFETQDRPISIFKGRATLEMAQLPYSLIPIFFQTLLISRWIHSHAHKLNRGISKYIQNPEDSIEYLLHWLPDRFDFSTSHLQGIPVMRSDPGTRLISFPQFFAEATAIKQY
jgi:hypothetical protein